MAKATETTKTPADPMQMFAELEARFERALKAAEDRAAAAEAKADELAKSIDDKKNSAVKLNELSQRLNDEGEEYVTVKLFKDNDKYSDDVFVAVNGEGCNIPRGIPQKIKRKFARQLEKSDLQDAKTAQYMTEKENEFVAESKARNL